jgi:hypothetical protein
MLPGAVDPRVLPSACGVILCRSTMAALRGRLVACVVLVGCGGQGQGQATYAAAEDAGPDMALPSRPDLRAPDVAADLGVPDTAADVSVPPDVSLDRPADLAPDAPEAPIEAAAPDAPVLVRDTGPPDGPDALLVWEDATCALETFKPEKLPFDLYLMLDSSFSMLESTAAGTSKWDAVRAAIDAFIVQPQAQGLGLGMGLQYFPLYRAEVPEECYVDADCGTAGPCKRARTCWPSDTVVLCDGLSDCGAGQTCVLLGSCVNSDNYCTQIGSTCSAGDSCLGIPGYCLGRDLCTAAAYAAPEVAIAPLASVGGAIKASLAARMPDGLSPTGPALAGALAHAQGRVAADPTRRAAVVLVSDGFPVECSPVGITDIAALAQTAAHAAAPVPTFAIGVFGADEAELAKGNLDAIALAGGTAKAFGINAGEDVTSAFLAALNDISTAALACEYKIPAAKMGAVDFAKVNVQFTAGNGGVSTLGNVANKAACDPVRGGWYYDINPAGGGTPTEMIACEASCTRLRADPKGQIDVVLGCRTMNAR